MDGTKEVAAAVDNRPICLIHHLVSAVLLTRALRARQNTTEYRS